MQIFKTLKKFNSFKTPQNTFLFGEGINALIEVESCWWLRLLYAFPSGMVGTRRYGMHTVDAELAHIFSSAEADPTISFRVALS